MESTESLRSSAWHPQFSEKHLTEGPTLWTFSLYNMTLYKFPSGKVVSDDAYRSVFAEEFPADRPEAKPDYIPPAKEGNNQVVFEEEPTDDDD